MKRFVWSLKNEWWPYVLMTLFAALLFILLTLMNCNCRPLFAWGWR